MGLGMVTYDFSGKVALVTGAAGGIGRATALAFAASGAAVTVADIDEDGVRETAEIIEKDGGQALVVRTDVADSRSAKDMVDGTVRTFGGLDFAHNNAGMVGAGRPVADMPDENWGRGIDVMLTGTFSA